MNRVLDYFVGISMLVIVVPMCLYIAFYALVKGLPR